MQIRDFESFTRFISLASAIAALYLANALFLFSTKQARILRYCLASYAAVLGTASVFIIQPHSKLVAATIRAFGAYTTMKTLDLHFSRGVKFWPRYDPTADSADPDLRMPRDPAVNATAADSTNASTAAAGKTDAAPVGNVGTTGTGRVVDGHDTGCSVWSYASRVTYSMRYEDFDISVIKKDKFTSHPMRQAVLSLALLTGIASTVGVPPYMTVDSSVISAFFFLLALHATFCGFHFLPGFEVPLFEKHFLKADSLSMFWTRHWHGLFTSPIKQLAFLPARRLTGSNAAGLVAAMAFSGLFHWFVVEAFNDAQASFRVFWFFALQGPACILDHAIWGRNKKPVVRKVYAWVVMLGLASWVVRGFPSVSVTNQDITWLVTHIHEGRI